MPVNLVLRIKDKDTHKAVKKIAVQKNQSLNGLINSLLEAEVKKYEKKTSKSLE
jgi:hypothetical protein